MHCLNSITVTDYLLYENQTFEFLEGISLVGGRNTHGKSLLFSGLEPLLYKSGKHPHDSQFRLNWSKGKREHDWTAKTTKNTNYTILENGKDQKPHKISDAITLINNAWTMNHDVFRSTVHLDGLRPHPLASGTASYRHKWLSDLLDLTTPYDELTEQIAPMIAACKEANLRVHFLSEELDDLKGTKREISKEDYQHAKKLVSNPPETIDSEGVKQAKKSLERRLMYLELGEPPKLDRDEFSAMYDDAFKKHYALKAQQGQDEKNKKIRARLKAAKRIVKEEEKNGKPPKPKKINAEINKATRLLENYETAKKDYDEQSELRDRVKAAKKETEGWNEDEMVDKLRKVNSQIIITKSTLKNLDSPHSGVCESCGSETDKKEMKGKRKGIKANLAKLETTSKQMELKVELLRLANTDELLNKPKAKATQKDLDKLEKKLKRAETYKAAKTFIKENSDLPEALPKSKYTKLISRYEEDMHEASEGMKLCRTFDKLEGGIFDSHSSLSKKQAKAELDLAKSKLRKAKKSKSLRKALVDASETVSRYETAKLIAKKNKKKRRELENKRSEAQGVAEDLKALEALKQAFGNSGLRLQKLNEAGSILAAKLTETGSMMFDSDYSFDIDVAPRKMDITIHRKGKSGDLSSMSGSETRIWGMIFPLAVMQTLPNSLRCDTVICDELEANLDQHIRDRYSKEYLPALNKIVPKVVVVTPLINGELKLVPDNHYMVEYDGKHSTIRTM